MPGRVQPASRTPSRLRAGVRKTAKWGGAIVTLALLVAWVGSAWWCLELHVRRVHVVFVYTGRLIYIQFPPRAPLFADPVLSIDSGHGPMRWSFEFDRWFGRPTFAIPLWFPVLGSSFVTAFAWRADAAHRRRVRAGACASCGYDRAGLAASSVCPECGDPVSR